MNAEAAFDVTNSARGHDKTARNARKDEVVSNTRRFFSKKPKHTSPKAPPNKDRESHTTTDTSGRWRIFAGVRMLGSSLDVKLAEGCAPNESRLLRSRSTLILSPTMRGALADNWLELLTEAREPAGFLNPRIPAVTERIIQSNTQILKLVNAITAPSPTPRGIAMARCLLCDVSGPLYDAESPVNLTLALDEIIDQLHALPT